MYYDMLQIGCLASLQKVKGKDGDAFQGGAGAIFHGILPIEVDVTS